MLRRLRNALGPKGARGTLLELAGFGLVVAAAWEFSRTAGLAAAGLVLILIALVVEGRR